MSKRALVVGGSGPTGPLVVNGLLARGFSVSVLSTGRHPAVFDGEVERIIADPHFAETLETALARRSFDVTLVQYGRLRVVAAALAGRTGHFVAVSTRAYPGWLDPASMHRPEGAAMTLRDLPLRYHDDAMPVDEATPLEAVGKFGARIVEADAAVRDHHTRGDFSATILRYPRLYGPRQGAAPEWSIIRRLIDGRRRLLVPEGGFLVRSALFNENAARIALAVVDRPDVAAGETFNCADAEALTLRAWTKAIAAAVGCEVDLVSLPMAMASPAWPYARFPLATGHQVLNTGKLARLGIDLVPVREALAGTVAWYLADPARGTAVEAALRDPFDYALEDRIITAIDGVGAEIEAMVGVVPGYAHAHAHPKAPD